ncbi:MAG TPA: xanthine dehydrogenase family protein molybdopterin-binding subunit [Acidimicrobiales bacterium]|nr:xanthine dehydrogenase family protein molybdopterin-binding subunit [Acidimicrobiales bacterium]
MSILGNRVLRREDPKFLTVGGSYVGDLEMPGAAYLSFVRSTVAHARIESVDVSQARNAPGVVAVYTNEDLGIAPLPPEMVFLNQAMTRSPLASGVVRHVGEPVVAIVAETRGEGADAAELVIVDYEPLSVVVDPEEARGNEILLFPELGTNVALALDFGADETLFGDCEVVVRQRIVNQRIAPCPLEGRSAAARVASDGRLEYYVSTQAPHGVQSSLAKTLALETDQIHVVSPDVGGGFGAKSGVSPEELLVAWAALKLARPVRWTETRSESMLGLGHGRGQVQYVTIGGNRDGKILAYRIEVLQDSGAYPAIGAMLPFLTRMMASGVYDISKVECSSSSVLTNTAPTVAYRGAGRPEATAAIERIIDQFAFEIGMDPAEVRRRNFVGKDAFPFTTPTGTEYDVGDYERTLDLALEVAGYDDLRAEQARRREAKDPHQLGIGLCTYVEITNGLPEGEFGAVEVRPDGKVIVRTGTSPHGQGHVTAWSMLVADALGVAIEDIEVIHGDTDIVPRGVGTFGSRSLQTGGVAVHEAAGEVVGKARQLAADLLEAAPDDVVLDKTAGQFHVAGTPALARSWRELAQASLDRDGSPLMAEVDFTAPGATFPFGTHIAVVDVDVETGKVTLLRHIAVDDAGTILNPLLAEGQVHGGIAQGVGQALLEEFVYDAEGNPLTGNLADYAFVSAAELPSYETRFTETPTPRNPLGAKGIGESGTIGSTPAVQNAVVDALGHLGVRHVDMPTTPVRVWQAIEAAARGA